MLQVGTSQGRTYEGQEGQGFASYLSFPKSDNLAMWKLQKDEEKAQKKALEEKQERQKALGVLDSFKPDWFYKHDAELNKEVAGFVDKAAKAMTLKANPFDATTPEGLQLIKEKDRIQGLIKLSQNQRELYDKYSQINKKDYDPKSVGEYEKFLSASIYDLADGKIPISVLRPKNPFDSELAVWSNPDFKNAQNEAQQRGVDLVDDNGLKTLISTTLNDNQNAKDFYQAKFDALKPDEQQIWKDKARKMTIAEGRQINPFEAMATEFLQKTLPRTPFDENKVIGELSKTIGNDETVVEKGSVTITNRNTGAAFKQKTVEQAKTFLLSDSPDAIRARRDKGITKEDILKGSDNAKAYINTLAKGVQAAKGTEYKRSEDELKRWQVALMKQGTGDGNQVLSDLLQSGDNYVQQQAINVIKGRNNALGANIDDAKIKKENGVYGIEINYTDDQPDPITGRKMQKTRFIAGTAENNGLLLDIIGGAMQGQKKDYKRVIAPNVKSQFESGGNAAPAKQSNTKKTSTTTKGKYSF